MDSLRSHIDHASMESDAPDNDLAYRKNREWVHLRVSLSLDEK